MAKINPLRKVKSTRSQSHLRLALAMLSSVCPEIIPSPAHTFSPDCRACRISCRPHQRIFGEPGAAQSEFPTRPQLWFPRAEDGIGQRNDSVLVQRVQRQECCWQGCSTPSAGCSRPQRPISEVHGDCKRCAIPLFLENDVQMTPPQ